MGHFIKFPQKAGLKTGIVQLKTTLHVPYEKHHIQLVHRNTITLFYQIVAQTCSSITEKYTIKYFSKTLFGSIEIERQYMQLSTKETCPVNLYKPHT